MSSALNRNTLNIFLHLKKRKKSCMHTHTTTKMYFVEKRGRFCQILPSFPYSLERVCRLTTKIAKSSKFTGRFISLKSFPPRLPSLCRWWTAPGGTGGCSASWFWETCEWPWSDTELRTQADSRGCGQSGLHIFTSAVKAKGLHALWWDCQCDSA